MHLRKAMKNASTLPSIMSNINLYRLFFYLLILVTLCLSDTVYATNKKQFLHWCGIPTGDNEKKAWLDRVPLEKWTQFYDENQ